jgi:hypothetical protein
MSHKSRRRATQSRRRVTMAAGALLAGAAIPLVAAGTAWADDDTITVAQAEKDAKAGEQVDISVNGKTIMDTCATCTADSGAVGDHNKAIAIGAGSSATDIDGAAHSTAEASTGGLAQVSGGSDNQATATGAGSAAYDDASSDSKATANSGGYASTSYSYDHSSATATGTNSNAYTEYSSNSSATATGTNSGAYMEYSSNSSATGSNDGGAIVEYSSDTKATATDTDFKGNPAVYSGGAADIYQGYDGSSASATGTNSNAFISEASGSSAVDNNGTTTSVDTNFTHQVNGMVVPHVEFISPPAVHVMPAMTLP